jgi:hypothetical protein
MPVDRPALVERTALVRVKARPLKGKFSPPHPVFPRRVPLKSILLELILACNGSTMVARALLLLTFPMSQPSRSSSHLSRYQRPSFRTQRLRTSTRGFV